MSYVSVLKPIINCLNICDMKKVIFMLAAIMASGMFCSCEEEKTPEEKGRLRPSPEAAAAAMTAAGVASALKRSENTKLKEVFMRKDCM